MNSAIALVCLKIFLGRIIDVSFNTLRTISVVRDQVKMAVICGFIEVFFWFMVVREALSIAEGGIIVALAYAGGFSMGTFVGSMLSRKLIKRNISAQIITSARDDAVVQAVQDAGYGVSVIDVKGSAYGNEKYMLIVETEGNRQTELRKLIHQLDEKAFFVVHDTRFVVNGFFGFRKEG